MILNEMMNKRSLTKYRLSKNSGIPYSTVSDIFEERTDLARCTAETVYKLAKALNTTMESLLAATLDPRCSFELFKSNVCHSLKRLGDITFIRGVLESDEISLYYNKGWYPESFYLLAMLDYISKQHNIPLCDKYSHIRKQTLQETIWPSSVIAAVAATGDESIKEKAKANCLDEFLKYNIIESEVKNIV